MNAVDMPTGLFIMMRERDITVDHKCIVLIFNRTEHLKVYISVYERQSYFIY